MSIIVAWHRCHTLGNENSLIHILYRRTSLKASWLNEHALNIDVTSRVIWVMMAFQCFENTSSGVTCHISFFTPIVIVENAGRWMNGNLSLQNTDEYIIQKGACHYTWQESWIKMRNLFPTSYYSAELDR